MRVLAAKLTAANEEIKVFNIFKTTGNIATTPLQPQTDPHEEDQDQDSYYELNDLSDDDNEEPASAVGQGISQRKFWLIRHSGATRLTIKHFNAHLGETLADECISFRDDNGYYTTYVHLESKRRITLIKRIVSEAVGSIEYKIVKTPLGPKGIQSTRHFWKIAAAIHSNDYRLRIETNRESGMFGRSPFRTFILQSHRGQAAGPAQHQQFSSNTPFDP